MQRTCAVCQQLVRYAYDKWRSVTLVVGRIVRLRLKIGRCNNSACARYHVAHRPEAEGRWALPEHAFGLEVMAQIGTWRYARTCRRRKCRKHRSIPEMH